MDGLTDDIREYNTSSHHRVQSLLTGASFIMIVFTVPAQASQWAARANTTLTALADAQATSTHVRPANHDPSHTGNFLSVTANTKSVTLLFPSGGAYSGHDDPGPSIAQSSSPREARQVSLEDLHRLPLLNCVIDEAMRVYPVAATASVR
jgi:hypothetical protein